MKSIIYTSISFGKNQSVFYQLIVSAGLALLSFSGAQAQCVLLDEDFDVNPVLSPTDVDGAWYPDRYPPAGFVSDVISGENALKISISAADGAQLRPGGFSSAFYNTQGRKFNQCGKCVTVLSGDIYIPSDWATKHRRTDMWATGFDISDAVADFPIIGFANVDGLSPTLRYWDGAAWVNVAGLAYDVWITLESSLVGTNIVYKVNGTTVGTVPSAGSVYLGNVIMQAYNFNDNTLTGGQYDATPDATYDAYWDNLITTGTGGNVVTNTNTGETFCSIQAAIDDPQTLAGHTIEVSPGTYNENVLVNKDDLIIRSTGGKAVTTIQGTLAGGNGTVMIASGTNGVTFGESGKGFTIIGYDGNGAIETAAFYLLGSHTDITIEGNEIQAQGEHGLLANFNAAIDGIVVNDNMFTGKTFTGTEPGGCGFATQFDLGNNVPRQLVTLGGGASVTNSMNVTFTNNMVTGTAGGFNTGGGCEQGNYLVTIDVIGAEIKSNLFNGTTTRFAGSLRARGSATSVACNTFESDNLGASTTHVFFGSASPLTGASPGNLAGVAAGNGYSDGGAYLTPDNAASYIIFKDVAQATAAAAVIGAGQSAVAASLSLNCPVTNVNTGEVFPTIQAAIDDAQTTTGHTIQVSAGTFNESVVVNKELTITGAGNGSNPATNTVLTAAVSCTGAGFTISAPNVTIQNMYVTDYQDAVVLSGVVNPTIDDMALIDYCRYGVSFGGSNSSVEITQTDIQRTTSLAGTVGIRVGTANAVNGLLIDGSTITGNALQGIVVFQATTPVAFDDITIQNSTISNNLQKGLYFEKLSNALFENLTMDNNGTDVTYGFNNGIDINLKHDNYSDITIQNCDITNSGANGTAGDPENAAVITIKARDDSPSYNTIPATLTDVTIKNNKITGPQNGIRFGEFGKINGTPSNVTVEGNDLSHAFAHKAVIRRTNDDVNLVCNWHGSTNQATILATFAEAGSGSIILSSILGTGGDASGAVGFQPSGSCTCASGNLVTNTNTAETFCSIQSAIDDAQTLGGHTLEVSAGTYEENVVLNKSLTLNGAQFGVDARGRVAGAPNPAVESVIAPPSGVPIELVSLSLGSVINGFAVVGSLDGATGAIISSSGPIDGIQLLNNHVQVATGFTASALWLNDNGTDITIDQNEFIAATGSSQAVHFDTDVFHGLHFTNNNVLKDGALGGTGFFVDGNRNVGTSATPRSPLIKGNLIQGHALGLNGGIRSFENAEISENTFTGNTGGFAGGPKNSNIARNTFSANSLYGLRLTTFGNTTDPLRGAQGTTVQNNFFTGNGTTVDLVNGYGDIRLDNHAPGILSTNTISNNSLLSSIAIFNKETDGDVANAECNWFGSAASGTVAGKIINLSGAVTDYTPWLTNGTDDDLVTAGFQPVAGSCGGTPVFIASAVPSPPACFSGSITVTFSGGDAPYDIAWTGGGSDMGVTSPYVINGLAPGLYDITVTDDNGSTATTNATVTVLPCTSISGNIEWHNDVPSGLGVKDATVNLTGAAVGSDLTDVNGDYDITVVATGNFTITPVKSINKLNGITVADAMAVQQHVAVINVITNPYRLVAADVNKSNSISTLDATIINQSLLGNPSALAQFKTSWRFVRQSYTMVIPPWGFPENIILTGVSGNQTDQDFYGMKTGDLVTAFANPANFGAGEPLVLRVQDQDLQAGTEITVGFAADQMNDLAAWQFALRFNPGQLQLLEIQPATVLSLTTDHFGTYNISEGEIRAVWSQAESVFLEEAAPVFALKFNVLEGGGKLSEALRLDEDALPALAYNSALAESGVQLNFLGTTSTGDPSVPPDASGVQLFQNRPNPFNGTTTIGFVLPESCEAQLRIFDVSGKILAERTAQYQAGRYEEIFNLEGASGVLRYELVTPFGILTKKMVAAK